MAAKWAVRFPLDHATAKPHRGEIYDYERGFLFMNISISIPMSHRRRCINTTAMQWCSWFHNASGDETARSHSRSMIQ